MTYTPHTWVTGDYFTPEQATEMSQEIAQLRTTLGASFVDNDDGTATITGVSIVDNGDGTATIT